MHPSYGFDGEIWKKFGWATVALLGESHLKFFVDV